MNNEKKFKMAYYKAYIYAKNYWDYCEDGFSNIIELEDSWFFGRNRSKDGRPIIDNCLGITISKQDLSIKHCHGGSDLHISLKEGKELDLASNKYNQEAEEFMNKLMAKYENNTSATEEDLDKELHAYFNLD